MSKFDEKIHELKEELKPNWDSYGADPIRFDLMEIAIAVGNFLESLDLDEKFGIYPLNNGSFQYETHSLNDYCVISIEGKETIECYISTEEAEYDEILLSWPKQKEKLKQLLDLL